MKTCHTDFPRITRTGKYSGTAKVQNELAIAQVGSGILANFGAKNVPREIGVPGLKPEEAWPRQSS